MSSTYLALAALLLALTLGVSANCDVTAYTDTTCATQSAQVSVLTDKCYATIGGSRINTYFGTKFTAKTYQSTDCSGGVALTSEYTIGECKAVGQAGEKVTRCPAPVLALSNALLALAAILALVYGSF